METKIAIKNESGLSIQEEVKSIKDQVNLIQHIMKEVMIEGEHFGTVPGCGTKKTLLKSGAEKLAMTFKLAPKFGINTKSYDNGHREYEIVVSLINIITGNFVGEGVGCCSTMEGKYRFRWENTNKPVPREYWDTRDSSILGGSQYVARKSNNEWFIFERIEHDNPADYYNTCLKMAKKRALVDAVLTKTAASDIFTQDIEDLVENGVIDAEISKPPESIKQPEKIKEEVKPIKNEGIVDVITVDYLKSQLPGTNIIKFNSLFEKYVTRIIKTKNGEKKVTDYIVIDADCQSNDSITITIWGSPIENLKIGDNLLFLDILVSEWKNELKFMAKGISKING